MRGVGNAHAHSRRQRGINVSQGSFPGLCGPARSGPLYSSRQVRRGRAIFFYRRSECHIGALQGLLPSGFIPIFGMMKILLDDVDIDALLDAARAFCESGDLDMSCISVHPRELAALLLPRTERTVNDFLAVGLVTRYGSMLKLAPSVVRAVIEGHENLAAAYSMGATLSNNDPQRQAPPSPRVPADKVARAGTPSITAWSIEQVHYAGELRVCLAGTFRSGPFDRGEYKRTSALVRVDHRRVFTRNSTYLLSTPSHTAEQAVLKLSGLATFSQDDPLRNVPLSSPLPLPPPAGPPPPLPVAAQAAPTMAPSEDLAMLRRPFSLPRRVASTQSGGDGEPLAAKWSLLAHTRVSTSVAPLIGTPSADERIIGLARSEPSIAQLMRAPPLPRPAVPMQVEEKPSAIKPTEDEFKQVHEEMVSLSASAVAPQPHAKEALQQLDDTGSLSRPLLQPDPPSPPLPAERAAQDKRDEEAAVEAAAEAERVRQEEAARRKAAGEAAAAAEAEAEAEAAAEAAEEAAEEAEAEAEAVEKEAEAAEAVVARQAEAANVEEASLSKEAPSVVAPAAQPPVLVDGPPFAASATIRPQPITKAVKHALQQSVDVTASPFYSLPVPPQLPVPEAAAAATFVDVVTTDPTAAAAAAAAAEADATREAAEQAPESAAEAAAPPPGEEDGGGEADASFGMPEESKSLELFLAYPAELAPDAAAAAAQEPTPVSAPAPLALDAAPPSLAEHDIPSVALPPPMPRPTSPEQIALANEALRSSSPRTGGDAPKRAVTIFGAIPPAPSLAEDTEMGTAGAISICAAAQEPTHSDRSNDAS